MKIISINNNQENEKKMSAIIHCDCGTHFEFEASDMLIKGNYTRTYHVTCPTCNTVHNYTDSMTEENQEEVNKYIDSCRSCLSCKYLAEIKEGYSSYTVTNISIECKMDKNKNMPLSGYEDRHEKDSVYAFAEKCSDFKNGVRYVKEVEELESEAFADWIRKNESYSSY